MQLLQTSVCKYIERLYRWAVTWLLFPCSLQWYVKPAQYYKPCPWNNKGMPMICPHWNSCLPIHKMRRPLSIITGPYRCSVAWTKLWNALYYSFNFIQESGYSQPFNCFIPGDLTINQQAHVYHIMCEALDRKKEISFVFCDISKSMTGNKKSFWQWVFLYWPNKDRDTSGIGTWPIIVYGIHKWHNRKYPLKYMSVCRRYNFTHGFCWRIWSCWLGKQKYLDTISKWADRLLLKFCPSKTETYLVSFKKGTNLLLLYISEIQL